MSQVNVTKRLLDLYETILLTTIFRNLSQKMDELEKQLNEMLVDEARDIFEMLIRNGDKDEERFTSIQLSIVHANRTADTIQVFLLINHFWRK